MVESTSISTTDLTHVFSSSERALTAISDVSLNVTEGQFVSIIGPSGCGKTTLLKCIGGLMEPTEGEVQINGQPPEVAQRQKTLGFVFQDPALLPWRTIHQNIRLPLEVNGDKTSRDDIPVDAALESVGLSDFRDYYPGELSGGMKQRVALARALVLDPSILLMDEPFGALDEMTRTEMRYELLGLWERAPRTALFVTHSIAEAVMLSDRVLVLSPGPGRVLEDISVGLPHPRVECMERSQEFLDYVRHIKGTLSSGVKGGTSAVQVRIAS